jgi:hypothetical protein
VGCNEAATVEVGNTELFVYFDPRSKSLAAQKRDTLDYLHESNIFSSLQMKSGWMTPLG